MKKQSKLLLAICMFFVSTGNIFSQNYNIKWGNMEKQSGRLQDVLPISGSDFYTLRWSGGALLGSLRLSRHDNLSLTATGKLVMQVDGSMANFEDATYMGDKLVVFLSDRKDGKNTIFMQEYNRDLTTKGSAKKMASYDLEKGRSKGFFNVIKSRNKEFFGVIWEIPGKKDQQDIYGFRIYDNELNEVSEGEYKLPFDSKFSNIHEHYLSNTGDYFISVMEFTPGEKKIFKSYVNFKAAHIYQITPDGIEDFTINLEGKRVEAMRMNSDNNKIFTITGIYGDQGKAGVTGLFYLRADFEKQELLDEGFEKFGKDFITQGWSDRQKEKAEKKEAKGKGEPQLYNYTMRQTEVLKDGSIVGSIEQYYVVVTTYTDPKTGATRTTYTYYYNDIIAYRVGTDGGFDWLKKINKTQVSTNDGGPFSSYSRFVDGENLCFIFNDHVSNYDEQGRHIKSANYRANFGKKKNVVAIVEIDFNDGKMDRTTFFDRKEISAIAVPKKFHVNYETKEVLLYAIYGKKERFGVMSIKE
jgi:hypothetical protein